MAIRIISWKEHKKNTLLGFVNLKLEKTGLEIRNCTVHEKDGRRWVSLPAKPYEDENGERGWEQFLRFDPGPNKQFQELTLEALDRFLSHSAKAKDDF